MKMYNMQLPVPEAVKKDPLAMELLHVWAAEGAQHIACDPTVDEDPGSWGIALVDLMNHISNAYAQSGAMDHAEALERVRHGFDAHWNKLAGR